MKSVTLKKNTGFYEGAITVPYSKSISNRAIIIRALSGEDFEIHHLSEADDTKNLLEVIHSNSEIIDVGPAGTNMRFLTGFFALQSGVPIIGRSIRLNQRPISDLVECLMQLGAQISYTGVPYYPPLQITGTELTGGKITIDGSKSSQFISSILMIAPYIKNGLELTIDGKIVSEPYIEMTLKLMKYFGVSYVRNENIICIEEQNYLAKEYTVEGDWSSAAMIYSFISGAKVGASLIIKNISLDSLQGDKKCAEYFSMLGVTTETLTEGIRITKNDSTSNQVSFDLTNEPDLFPPLAVACVLNKTIVSFTGLDTLPQKESNRIEAIATELGKINVELEYTPQSFTIKNYGELPSQVSFDTYHDHRMAMSLAAIVQLDIEVSINNPDVVSKSYPDFWKDLKTLEIANIY